MSSDEYVPKKKRRRIRLPSTSSESEGEDVPNNVDHEATNKESNSTAQPVSTQSLTADDLLKIIASLRGDSNKILGTNQQLNVIPEFDPNNKSQNVERWLKKVNECSTIYGWNEKQTIHFSLQKLCGLAKKWYESLSTLTYSWEEWQVKLQKSFPSDENYGIILQEMLNRRCRYGENVREYFYEKLALLTRCEIIGRKAVDCVVHGINDASIRSGAQALQCTEPEDLLAYLVSQQSKVQTGFQMTNQPKRKEYNNSYNSYSPNVTKGTNANDSGYKGGPSCFNCQERGHTFYKCPKPIIKCHKCGRVGHDLDNCTKKPILSHNPTQVTPIRKTLKICSNVEDIVQPNVEEANQKFYKTITIDNTLLQAYIDFGSDCTLIRLSDAKRLGINEDYDNLPIVRGFGNASIKPLFKSVVNARLDDIEARLELLVVNDEYLHTSVLVGRNFTELPNLMVLKDKENLYFYNSPFQTADINEKINLFVTNKTLIEKGGLIEVISKEDYSGDIYLEGDTRLNPNQEYRLHSGCYRLERGKGFVFVTALTNTPVLLDENSLIARVKPAVECRTLQVISENIANPLPLDKNEVKIGSELDKNQFERLYELLQKYRSCFATNLTELGCTKEAEMSIELSDNKPVVYRPYRMSFYERGKVREMVEELIENDIVQESQSNYASPVLLVKKKTGDQRLCIDFRALNNKTVKDKYPLPLIEDQISNLSGNKFFITLDLASGYYQIPMAEESRHLTAFVTPDGHYEFKRMPFGLANAPAIFQKMINKVLGSRRFTSALAYMDDLLIPSESIDEGFAHLEDVLKLLRDAGLTLKLAKCRFFDTQLEYLGYEISADGIKPSERKITAVKDFPVPRNIHEVRQFLGLASYFRKFVQGFGEIARPLTMLLKKESSWQWKEKENLAFETLKARLIERPILALYDPKLDTELHADASSLGLGGILLQWQINPRVLKPVAYFSRQTTPEEHFFHSYELETLAVVCSLKKFRVYLLGLRFTVFTDCNALRTTLTKRDLIPRIARWWLQISEFDFNIEYRAGCRMSHVDALSRNPPVLDEIDSRAKNNDNLAVFNISTENWLLTLQLADPELVRITKILKPKTDDEVVDIKKNYVMKDNVLHRKVGDQLKLVVPRNARWQVCRMNHDDIGHFEQSKTLERIQDQYWFPKLRRFVKKYVAACINCAYTKDSAAKVKSGHLHPIEKKAIPFHTLHIDHLGPFVRSKSRNSYILTVVDGFTKYLFAKPVKDTKTKNVIKVLDNIFIDFGTPERIISDRGSSFTSSQFKDFCITNGIKHILNAVASPRSNGQAERFNQTLLNALSSKNLYNDERDWDKQLGTIQWGINNTVSATTKKAPSELLFGLKLNNASTNKFSTCIDDSLKDVTLGRDNLRQVASKNIQACQEKQKAIYDANKLPAKCFEEGDLVKIVKSNFNNDGKIVESGDEPVACYGRRTLVLANHQSTADVPMLMAAWNPRADLLPNLMWIMDRVFKFTNFGIVSVLHEDFFIQAGKSKREQSLEELRQHIHRYYIPLSRQFMVLFPEGGFLHKRREVSQRFAEKNNLPKLEYVSLPRAGAMKVIMEEIGPNADHGASTSKDTTKKDKNFNRSPNIILDKNVGDSIEWILDVTIAYPERVPLHLVDVVCGVRPACTTHLHYRLYHSSEVPADTEGMTQWLYDRFIEKDKMLEQYYNTGSFPSKGSPLSIRPVRQDNVRYLILHLFFILSTYVQYKIICAFLGYFW